MRVLPSFVMALTLLAGSLVSAVAQRPGVFNGSRDHPAIRYSSAPVTDPVFQLNQALESGRVSLDFDQQQGGGYLRAVLTALDIPISSQMLVFAQTSSQARKISRDNPRAVYFNDTVSVAWVRGGDVIEMAASDPQQGAIFYTLPMAVSDRPRFTRNDGCLACHLSWDTLAVPGFVLQTVFPRQSDRDYADGGFVDDRLAIDQRWGGFFVTGAQVPARHMGNQPLLQPTPRTGPAQKLSSVAKAFDTTGYLTDTSDVTALLVFDHQVHAGNLIARLNWEARAGTAATVEEAAHELADYLLFVDEAPIPGKVVGNSGFAAAFAAEATRTPAAATLRRLKLDGRLMTYPLSYMIDTPMFAALPDTARRAVVARIKAVAQGQDPSPNYAHLTAEARQMVLTMVESLR